MLTGDYPQLLVHYIYNYTPQMGTVSCITYPRAHCTMAIWDTLNIIYTKT